MALTGRAGVTARKADRRRRLLAAALELFAQRGFHETSVDEIVALARTSKSAFYVYFQSKEDCFRVLLEEEGGAFMAAVDEAALAERGGHAVHLRRGLHEFVRRCFQQARTARLLLVESVGLSESIEAVRSRLHAQFAGMVEAEVRRGQADGEFFGTDPALFGRAVVGAVNEVVCWALASGQPLDADRVAGELCRIFRLD